MSSTYNCKRNKQWKVERWARGDLAPSIGERAPQMPAPNESSPTWIFSFFSSSQEFLHILFSRDCVDNPQAPVLWYSWEKKLLVLNPPHNSQFRALWPCQAHSRSRLFWLRHIHSLSFLSFFWHGRNSILVALFKALRGGESIVRFYLTMDI